MNINEFNPIKSINIEAAMNTETGTGTFKEILDKVYSDEIRPLVMNDGTIVGISYDAHTSNHIEDNLEQVKFERRYAGKDVMTWVLKALELKAKNAKVKTVTEQGDDVKVVLEDGTEIVVSEHYSYNDDYDAYEDEDEVLPDEEEIPYDEIDLDDTDDDEKISKAVRDWLRNTYDHYLAKGCDLDIECDDDAEVIYVSNIEWGRKR